MLRHRHSPTSALVPRARYQAPSKASAKPRMPRKASCSLPWMMLWPSPASAMVNRASPSQPMLVMRQWAWRHRQKLAPPGARD
jgi:hypothetical protein